MGRFRNGGYNVLVATCIGEEGLDIGNVDLILCFDMQASPIRMLQRIGRTGRHRDGKIVLLLGAGKEEQRHRQTITQHRSVQKAINNAKETFSFFIPPTRIAPSRAATTCVERHFDVSSNVAFLERRTEAQPRSAAGGGTRRKESGGKAKSSLHHTPSVFDSIAQYQFDAVPPFPSLERLPPWQRTAGPYFVVSHSATTARLVDLYAQFDDLDQMPSPLIRRADFAPETQAYEQRLLPRSPREDRQVALGDLQSQMRQAIQQMTRRSAYPEHALKPWAEYQSSFSALLSPPPDVAASIQSDLPEAAPIATLHQSIAIPDDFFDDMEDDFGPAARVDLPRAGEPSENKPAPNGSALSSDMLAGLEKDFFESSLGTMGKSSKGDLPRGLFSGEAANPRAPESDADQTYTQWPAVRGKAVPISPAADVSCIADLTNTSDVSPVRASLVTPLGCMQLHSTTETPSSGGLLEGCPKSLVEDIVAPSRRRNVTIETSSPDARPAKRRLSPCSPHGSRRGLLGGRPARSKFVLSEAPCSDDDSGGGTDDNCSEASSGMADFINDCSGSDWTRSEGRPSQLSETAVSDETPSTGEMMAFYRQTAHHSQPDPRFQNHPRQFAVKRRMNPTGRGRGANPNAPLQDGKEAAASSTPSQGTEKSSSTSEEEDSNGTPPEDDALLLPCDWSTCFAA